MIKSSRSDKHIESLRCRKIKLLVAIPRSNSTIIESVLSSSPSIKKTIHEPFHEYGYYNLPVSSAYEKIDSTLKGTNIKDIFLIKEMAHWITIKSVHKPFLLSVNSPILLLIRNPLLNIESKINKILQGASRKNRPGLNKYLFSYLNKNKKFDNKQDSRTTLDQFSQKYNYISWKELIEKELTEKRNLIIFTPILEYYSKSAEGDIWGWESMKEIKIFLRKNKIPYRILDGTDFRLESALVTQIICNELDIKFDKKMLKISENQFRNKIISNQKYSHNIAWYDKVISNDKILKPDCLPLTIENFPNFIQSYIFKKALPTYSQMSRDKNRINIYNYKSFKTKGRKVFV